MEMIKNAGNSWFLNKFFFSEPLEMYRKSRENMHTDVRV